LQTILSAGGSRRFSTKDWANWFLALSYAQPTSDPLEAGRNSGLRRFCNWCDRAGENKTKIALAPAGEIGSLETSGHPSSVTKDELLEHCYVASAAKV